MNKWQQKAMMDKYYSKSYYTFMDQFNNFEDGQLKNISIAVNSFCEHPTKEKLDEITALFNEAKSSIAFISKNMKRYLESGMSDITQSELGLVNVYLTDLIETLKFEAETVADVIEDETYNAAFAVAMAAEKLHALTA